MPLVQNPASPLVPRLEGLHLFHFDGAPCAQRVRFALGEKGLVRGREEAFHDGSERACKGETGRWVSRKVSLVKKDHLTPQYAAIHPNLVVPALVHDGRLYIESMDIVAYLDEAFGGTRLVPQAGSSGHAEMTELLTLGEKLHRSIRFVTFRWGLGRLGRLSAAEEAQLRELVASGGDGERLVEFYEGYDRQSFAEQIYEEHLRGLVRAFTGLDARLSDGRAFLTGDTVTMADAMWAMKVLRLTECGYPFSQVHPAVFAWFGRISQRPSFKTSVMGKHALMHRAFRVKAWLENRLGTGLASAVLQQFRDAVAAA